MKLDFLLEQIQQNAACQFPRQSGSGEESSGDQDRGSSGRANNDSNDQERDSTSPASPVAVPQALESTNPLFEWANALMRHNSFPFLGIQQPVYPLSAQVMASTIANVPANSSASFPQFLPFPSPATVSTAPIDCISTQNATSGSQKPNIVPLSKELADQGLHAIGGCRQCSRTFSCRLELIHHFCDHFPAIFYSFESLKEIEDKSLSVSDPGQNGSNERVNGLDLRTNGNNSMKDATVSGQVGPINPTEFFNIMQRLASRNVSNMQGNTTDSADTTSSPSVFSQISLNSSNRVIPAKSENNVENQKHGPPKPTKTKKKEDRNGRKSSSVMDSTWNTSLPSYLLGTQKMSPAGGSFNDVRKNGQDLPYHMCPHCCLTFADLQPFQDHMKTHSESGNAIERVNGDGSQPKVLKCHFCEMRFSNPYQLLEHENMHAHKCSLCNKAFLTNFDLNLHMGTHTGFTYDCKDCGQCFPCRKSLAEHNKSHRNLSSSVSPRTTESGNSASTTSLQANLNSTVKPVTSSTSAEKNASQLGLDFSLPVYSNTSYHDQAAPHMPHMLANPMLHALPQYSLQETLDGRPPSLFQANPYFQELLRQNGTQLSGRRKRRSKSGTSRRANGEKSRRQTTLVAMELQPEKILEEAGVLGKFSDRIPALELDHIDEQLLNVTDLVQNPNETSENTQQTLETLASPEIQSKNPFEDPVHNSSETNSRDNNHRNVKIEPVSC
ncbi:zinc finger protein 13 [Ditylenchus destructor]|uniref:Zinc finger protein 13 n=1 Tax=Ditylenchus destructor TaxID=166010 RepID=A0AAD4NBT7_9BILA|nr:zinc finger protein 13 [Ditylenchus destructor]